MTRAAWSLARCAGWFVFGGMIFFGAVIFRYTFLSEVPGTFRLAGIGRDGSMLNWDGQWYARICASGYDYDASGPSSINFFPAYPLTARMLCKSSGLSCETSLIIVSNFFFLLSMIFLDVYLAYKRADAAARDLSLLALTIVPTALFFRVAYTESMFLAEVIILLVMFQRRSPLLAQAAVIGLATGTRSMGIALIPAFLVHAWRRLSGPKRVIIPFLLLPVACWGVLAFMTYQGLAFGTPLACAKGQYLSALRVADNLSDKVVSLVTFEPAWSCAELYLWGYWVGTVESRVEGGVTRYKVCPREW
jgi:Mannosyltransferase (PIG-V)